MLYICISSKLFYLFYFYFGVCWRIYKMFAFACNALIMLHSVDCPERSGQLGDRMGSWCCLQGNRRLFAESKSPTKITKRR